MNRTTDRRARTLFLIDEVSFEDACDAFVRGVLAPTSPQLAAARELPREQLVDKLSEGFFAAAELPDEKDIQAELTAVLDVLKERFGSADALVLMEATIHAWDALLAAEEQGCAAGLAPCRDCAPQADPRAWAMLVELARHRVEGGEDVNQVATWFEASEDALPKGLALGDHHLDRPAHGAPAARSTSDVRLGRLVSGLLPGDA